MEDRQAAEFEFGLVCLLLIAHVIASLTILMSRCGSDAFHFPRLHYHCDFLLPHLRLMSDLIDF